ncbi:MAG: hypothetical protein ACJA0Q_000367 [Saprospiraceae bacterium]|jgi:hypothetical protein
MKRNNSKYTIQNTLMILVVFIIVVSCQKKDTNYSKTSLPQAFLKVELHSSFDVFLKEDSVYSIRAIGRQDVIESLLFTVTDSVLKIEDPRKSEWRTPKSNKVTLYITSPPLSQVTTYEACNIETLTPITSQEFGLVLGGKANEATLDLKCDVFYYWSGSVSGGKITLTGNCNELKLWNTGLIQIDAMNLTTDYALIENKSRGTCEVNVANKLDYAIYNSGDIIVHGSPAEINELSKKQGALGQLIQK